LNEKSSGSRSIKQRLTAVGTRCADHVTPLYPQKLALTSPTGGGCSVGIVRVRTKATEFFFIYKCYRIWTDFDARLLQIMQLRFAETSAGKTARAMKPFRHFESTERFGRVLRHGVQHLQSYSLRCVLILSSRVPQNDLFSGSFLIINFCADFTFLIGISVDRNANTPL